MSGLQDSSISRKQLDRILSSFFKGLCHKHDELRTMTESELPLLQWSQKFLGSHFSSAPSKMHKWLCTKIDSLNASAPLRLNVLAPRGAAKSTIGTLAFPLKAALDRTQSYIWIVSDTMSQAHAHLENIKSELEQNELLANAYPKDFGKGPVWRSGTIVTKNGTMIEAFGSGQKLRGRKYREHRPSLILCDDLQNENHIHSLSARDKSREWFYGTLLKAGDMQTSIFNLATALHDSAIAMELFKKPGWVSRKFQAIEQWPINVTLWEEWEMIYTNLENEYSKELADRFYEQSREAMNEGCEVLWPEREDIYTLMKMRVEGGRTAFEREKQNSPVNPEYCEWPETDFDETIWYENEPNDLMCSAMSLDPSKGSDSRRGDYSAFVCVRLSKEGCYYVDADLARYSLAEIVDKGVELYEKWNPEIFAIESNQFQSLLEGNFVQAFKERKLFHVRPYPMENRINKIVRIRRLGPLLSAKKIKFKRNSPSVKLLLEQMKTFPVGDHDDGPDALEMCVRIIGQLIVT